MVFKVNCVERALLIRKALILVVILIFSPFLHNPGNDTGKIRVINMKTTERTLIKGIEGMTQDVAFAFITFPVLVACIDSVGDVYVYSVEENQFKALSCCLMLHIKQVLLTHHTRIFGIRNRGGGFFILLPVFIFVPRFSGDFKL